MKRKLLAPLALAVLVLSLSGCAAAGAVPAMYIQPAGLTEEEEAIARLLGADTGQHLFDVVLDGTAKRASVNIYELVDGEWEPFSGGGGMALGEEDARGRMAFGFEDLRGDFRQAVQFGKNCSSVSWQGSEDEGENLGRATAFLSNRAEIVYEKEIPIAVQINTARDQVSSYDPEYFFQPEEYEKFGYEHVYALTVMFSREPPA